jgi:opacity protein-like surface antigen
MRKLVLIVLLLLLSAPISLAQTTSTSTIPVTDKLGPVTFIGYSYMQADGMPPTVQSTAFNNNLFGNRTGMHGMVSETTYYLTRRFGITADFSFNQRTRSFTTTTAGGTGVLQNSLGMRVINILGGPQVRFPNHTRAIPFARALFGVANTRFQAAAQQTIPGGFFTNTFDTSQTNFAMALGGGLDVQLNNRIGVRVFQIDYNPVFLRDRSISVVGQGGAVQTQTLESNRQDNIRIGVGVLIR